MSREEAIAMAESGWWFVAVGVAIGMFGTLALILVVQLKDETRPHHMGLLCLDAWATTPDSIAFLAEHKYCRAVVLAEPQP